MSGRKRLALTLLYTTALIGMVPFVRAITNPLRDAGLLRITVAALLSLTLAVTALALRRAGHSAQSVIRILLSVAAPSLLIAPFVVSPEEFLHLPEYAAVGGLWLWTFRARFTVWPAVGGASVLSLLTGLLDEGIQHITPDRYFGWNDITFDCLAAWTGIAILSALFPARDEF